MREVITGLHVIASAPASVGDDNPVHIEIWPFDNRTWVSVCSAVHPAGCGRPELSELDGDRWVPGSPSLRGLPPIEAINLYAPRTPLAIYGHEADPPFDSPRGQCLYRSLLEGSRSIAMTAGSYPDNAWMVLRAELDHSGVPVDDLFVWQNGWRRIFEGKRAGDTLVKVIPWAGGAVAAIELARPVKPGFPPSSRYDYTMVHFTVRGRRVLVVRQPQPIHVGIVKGELVAVVPQSAGEFEPVSTARILRWTEPNKARSSSVAVDQEPSASSLEVSVGDRIEMRWVDSAPKKLVIELDDALSRSLTIEPRGQADRDDNEPEPPLIRLPAPYRGETDFYEARTVRGRRFWMVTVTEPTERRLLLSDAPTRELWTAQPKAQPPVTVSRCEKLPETDPRGEQLGF